MSNRVKVQALGAKETYEFKQEIMKLQKRLKEAEEQLQAKELEKQTLEQKAAAMNQQNEKIKGCANTFASMYVYGSDTVNSQLVWCSQQLQNPDLNSYLRQAQGRQRYSYPPHQ